MRTRLARAMIDRIFPGSDWLVPVMARALPGAAVVLGLSLLAASAGLAAPLITKAVIDEGILARDMTALLFWAAVSFALGLCVVGLGIVNGMTHLRASMRLLGDLRATVLGAALGRDPVLPPLPVGEIQTRIDGDTAEIQKYLFDSGLVAIGALFRLTGGAVLMLMLDWRLALLPVLAAPFELWFLTWARPGTQSRAETVRAERGGLNGHLSETFVMAQGLRMLGALGARAEGFGTRQERLFDAQARQRLWTEAIGAVSQCLTAVTRAAVLLVGGWLVVRGDWQIGSLVAFLAYATMMSGPLRNLLGLYHAQARASVALARLDAIMRDAADPEAGTACPLRIARLDLTGARAKGGTHAPVTVSLMAGEWLHLDGPSGIGKSRLLGALVGEAPLAEGRIEIDGHDAASFSLGSRRRAVTVLPQRPCLLRGSLRDSLLLGQPDPGDAALWDALDLVDLADWAQGLAGLETDLQETGANLSGGMRQRIALARALLRPTAVMVFDESFSEVDAATCRRILSAMADRLAHRLCIFVAHAGPVRAQAFDRVIDLSASAPALPERVARIG